MSLKFHSSQSHQKAKRFASKKLRGKFKTCENSKNEITPEVSHLRDLTASRAWRVRISSTEAGVSVPALCGSPWCLVAVDNSERTVFAWLHVHHTLSWDHKAAICPSLSNLQLVGNTVLDPVQWPNISDVACWGRGVRRNLMFSYSISSNFGVLYFCFVFVLCT